jgi:hypothetical protein
MQKNILTYPVEIWQPQSPTLQLPARQVASIQPDKESSGQESC